jgi:hypothetical protein
VAATLTGSNFTPGAAVSIDSTDVTITNVAVAGAAQITASFAVSPAAVPGPHNVTVTTAGGASNSVTFTVTPASTTIRVNAGGSAFIDSFGQNWSADTGYNNVGGPSSTNNTILGTPLQQVYKTAHWGNPPGSAQLVYTFAGVPDGAYVVNLKFVDALKTAPGQRIFNILINGQTRVSNFDIFAQAGSTNQAIDVPLAVNSSGGTLTIQTSAVTYNPKINAIEIIPAALAVPASISSISPASGAAGATTHVTINGSGFNPDVVVNAGNRITVSNVNVVSPSQITADFTVAAGTAPGTVSVSVAAPGGSSTASFTTQ